MKGKYSDTKDYFRDLKKSCRAFFGNLNSKEKFDLFFRKVTAHGLWIVLGFSLAQYATQYLMPLSDLLTQNVAIVGTLTTIKVLWDLVLKKFIPEGLAELATGEFLWGFENIKTINHWICGLLAIDLVVLAPMLYQKVIYGFGYEKLR